MLERAQKNLPESVRSGERFEVPPVRGHIQGNRTVISNFSAITDALHRNAGHILKFILKELATPGVMHLPAAILGRKISASAVNEKLRKYAEIFVICPECGRPDTKLKKDGQHSSMTCQACGASHPVRTIM